MTARLLSIATATPRHSITQAQAAEMACQLTRPNGHERAIRALYQRAGIHQRGSVLARHDGSMSLYEPTPHPAPQPTGAPTTAQRLQNYTAQALELAHQACAQALQRADTTPREITHLITVSCTGFEAPGVDCALIDALSIPATVRRTHIGFMGCHGAINALAAAKAYAEADPGARVLVCCVELCTLHFQYEGDQGASVANALFADGAAAALIAATANNHAPAGTPAIRGVESIVLPNTRDAMTWRIGDHGFVMSLSSRVPDLLAAAVPSWLDSWLPRYRLTVPDIRSWALHPGGPRILHTLADALQLGDNTLAPSRTILAQHGNMSSATVLFIAEQILRKPQPLPLIAMAFGPGLTGEAILLTKQNQ